MLVGIICRGSAFVFRRYGSPRRAAEQRWGRVFAVASTITPVLLGVIIGAIASGRVAVAAALLPGGADTAATTSFMEVFVAPWLSPFPLAVGVMALVLFAFLAAVYLTVAARDDALREDFRRRALFAAAVLFATAFATLALAGFHAPHVGRSLLTPTFAVPFQSATAVAALAAIWSLWTRRWRLARLAAAAQVSLILWGWELAQYPYLIPPSLSIRDAAAPRITLELLLWALVGGSIILIPSLFYLLRTFAASREPVANAEGGGQE
jgi:cytochrome d ubiquinol oxidase subunit II